MSERTSREKTLYRYHLALERGDFATVAAILSQAEQDATLARMLLELNAALEAEVEVSLSLSPAPRANHSTNGQRHPGAPAREEPFMTVYEATHPGRRMPSVPLTGRKPMLTLIAAVIVVALIGAALLSSGLPAHFEGASGGPADPSGPAGLPGAGLQAASATPSPTFTSTPVPTASPTFLPTVVGPQPDPLILTATSIVVDATRMAVEEYLTMVPTVPPFIMPDVVTATPFPMNGEMYPLMPTVVPPGVDFSTAGPIMMGLPLETTMTMGLMAGSVTSFQITADEAGALLVTATSLDFTPRLLVIALDDADLEVRRNQDDQDPPTVVVPTSAGDRVLIFVYSVDREATGQFLINAHME